MEDKINELRDKRDVLVEELASVEDKISKTSTDALEYDTLCKTQDTIEEQIEVIDKEIELLLNPQYDDTDFSGVTNEDR
jgi:chromosome segregation ATPase